MEKIISFIAVTILLGMGVVVLAEGQNGNMGDKGMEMMGGGMIKSDRMDMMDGKMMGMMQKSVVATSDGGIVFFVGNKITKYDKDLKVVKEVELK